MERKQGEYKEYFSTGQLRIKEHYQNGKLEGLYERFYKNGQVEFRVTYKNGERDGEFKRWFKNGLLEDFHFLKQGERDGLWKRFNKNGKLIRKCYYKNGCVDSIYKHVNKDKIKNWRIDYWCVKENKVLGKQLTLFQIFSLIEIRRKLRLHTIVKKYKTYLKPYLNEDLNLLILKYL